MRRSFRGTLFDFNVTSWDGVRLERQAQQSGGHALSFAQAAGLTTALTCVASAVVAESLKHNQSNWLVLTELQPIAQMQKLHESSEVAPMVQGSEDYFTPPSLMQVEQADMFSEVAYYPAEGVSQAGVDFVMGDLSIVPAANNNVGFVSSADVAVGVVATDYSGTVYDSAESTPRGGDAYANPASYQPQAMLDAVKMTSYQPSDFARPAHDLLRTKHNDNKNEDSTPNNPSAENQRDYADDIADENDTTLLEQRGTELDGCDNETCAEPLSNEMAFFDLQFYDSQPAELLINPATPEQTESFFKPMGCWYNLNTDENSANDYQWVSSEIEISNLEINFVLDDTDGNNIELNSSEEVLFNDMITPINDQAFSTMLEHLEYDGELVDDFYELSVYAMTEPDNFIKETSLMSPNTDEVSIDNVPVQDEDYAESTNITNEIALQPMGIADPSLNTLTTSTDVM